MYLLNMVTRIYKDIRDTLTPLLVMDTTQLMWHCFDDPMVQQSVFHNLFTNNQAVKEADWLLCNSFYEIKPSAYPLNPNLLPIGPLFAGTRQRQLAGNFWQESFTVLEETQFHELVLGLELTDQRFLWVVRPDLSVGQAPTYPDGFEARVADRGRTVSWAPEQKGKFSSYAGLTLPTNSLTKHIFLMFGRLGCD
ncbi:hypothetical protein HHK36_030138 [Tetracentron sinense]|uniref:Uncharacterized protein n=1 Tax=Tetracentron sinense TaxID=13715 RepID=A0A834YG02_TETSI|nr:hypothetical protein HHK36_030138 [Tetracentron sinense]